jgi:acyl-CoA thioesterase I
MGRFQVVALGTSLTAIGGWHKTLETELARAFAGEVSVDIVAKNGANSQWGISALPSVIALAPDIVLMEFASNDAALHRGMHLGKSCNNIRTIVRALDASGCRKIILMAMSPLMGWRRAVRPCLNLYYDSYRDLAAELGVSFIDHRPGWAKLSRRQLATALPDGSHPDPAIAGTIIVPTVIQAIAGMCEAGIISPPPRLSSDE